MDTQELELPKTVFSSNLDDNIFQGIAIQCLSKIEGVALVEENFINTLFHGGGLTHSKGIAIGQDTKNHSITIKLEINVCYGISIPKKAEEIQSIIAEEITKYTGLHVSCVHIIFRNVIPNDPTKRWVRSVTTNAQENQKSADIKKAI